MQIRDSRQGPRQLSGTFSGQLAPGAYSLFLQALMRATYMSPTTSGVNPLTDLTAASQQGGSAAALTSNSSNFRTMGFNIGDVVRLSGLGSTAYAADDNMPLIVQSIGTNGAQMIVSVQSGFVFFGTAQSAKISGVKKLIMPQTGVVQPSFTIEEWYNDVGVSDLSLGCTVTQMQIQMPARGFCTFSASFTGQNQVESSAQVYTAPTAPSTATSLMMLGGQVLYNGVIIAYMSNATLSISSPTQADPAIGSNIVPAVFLGNISVTGSFTTLMANDTMTNDFLAENEVSLLFLLATSQSAYAGFVTLQMPRCKLGAATKQDSQTAITRSFNFQALENITVADADDSTLIINDSGA
jgi:hypothetical protein